MKNNRGITLIALVITIIVLLILAGVSIAMLTGENGILNQATTAKDDTAAAEAVERMNMELNALYSAVLADDTKTEFTAEEVQAVKTNLTGTNCSVTETGAGPTVTLTTTVSGATGGSIEITAAGTADLEPAALTE